MHPHCVSVDRRMVFFGFNIFPSLDTIDSHRLIALPTTIRDVFSWTENTISIVESHDRGGINGPVRPCSMQSSALTLIVLFRFVFKTPELRQTIVISTEFYFLWSRVSVQFCTRTDVFLIVFGRRVFKVSTKYDLIVFGNQFQQCFQLCSGMVQFSWIFVG